MIPLLQGAEAQKWLNHGVAGPAGGELAQTVAHLIERVRREGDWALKDLARQFNDPPPRLILPEERDQLAAGLDEETRQVLVRAAHNIETFARAVVASIQPVRVEGDEFVAAMEMRPVASAACYAPGGRHPLPSTALMTGLAAKAAGVQSISLVCPSPHPAVMVAAQLVGAHKIYQMGGAQAVAALALGTESVEAVDMVVGPGNAYVTEAKRQLQGLIGIDMLAGPSEVTIIADGGANPEWVALDLLAQAEHDPDARVVLLTWEQSLAEAVQGHINRLLQGSVAYPAFLQESLHFSALLVLDDLAACQAASDRLAPEHLHLAVEDPHRVKAGLRHYGGLFLGYTTTVPFGDYVAGPNHTLPTGRSARFSAGLSPLTFLRSQCWLEAGSSPRKLAADAARFAEVEGLVGHAAAARARID